MSNGTEPALGDRTPAQHQAAWDAWVRNNREQEVLQAVKWRKIALVVLPIVFSALAFAWFLRAQ